MQAVLQNVLGRDPLELVLLLVRTMVAPIRQGCIESNIDTNTENDSFAFCALVVFLRFTVIVFAA